MNPRRSSPARGPAFTRPAFTSPAAMARALNELASLLRQQAGPLGFVLETVRVEFSNRVEELEVETRFAESVATIVVPAREHRAGRGRDRRRTELLGHFLPAIKEAQLRALLELYAALSPAARRRLGVLPAGGRRASPRGGSRARGSSS